MQQLPSELDDNGTNQATRNDLTSKMRAIAVQVVELSGTNSWRLPRCTACAESGRGILIRLLASAT